MPQRTLGTLTIGQAPRPDVVPIIDRHVPAAVRRVHRGVLDGLSHAEIAERYRPEGGEPALVTRLHDGTVVELAQAIYDHRAFERLPMLANVLEQVGCQDATILGHCRHPGPHVRGCWAIDCLLGKR